MPLRVDKPTTLYTIEEARKVIGVSQPTLWKAVAEGKLKATKYGHYVFIAEEDLLEWKAKHYHANKARRRKTTHASGLHLQNLVLKSKTKTPNPKSGRGKT